MFKLILITLFVWFIFKIIKNSKIGFKKTSIHTKDSSKKKDLRFKSGDVEDADFEDVD